jgi:hypothetical protein
MSRRRDELIADQANAEVLESAMMQNIGPRENRSANSWPIRDSWRFAPFRSNVHELRGGSNAGAGLQIVELVG